ncbi:MAG: heme biosynthesis protein HemY [Rhizobium sp.]|nr:heme biosynthesis protein HemY [Rhizobium sp.]
MIRIVVFLLLILALGFGFSWLADRPGELYIIWQGQRVSMTLMVAAVLVTMLVVAIMIGWWLVRTIWTSPQSMTRYFRARKRDRGYQALSTGLIAVGSGDAPLARKMLDRTKGLISSDSEPLIHLLEAQASLIEGKTEDARKKFEAMSEDPETRELGLRGLYLEALRVGAHEAARHYAEKAVEKGPHLPWAAEATLEYRTQAGRYDEAIRLLEGQRVLSGMDRKVHDRRKAVLLTGRALSKLDADPRGARDDAYAALKLAPDLVPAATTVAKAYLREDNVKKALAVIEQVFKLVPHMELVTQYLAAGGVSAQEKVKRAVRLQSLQPASYEGVYAVASASFDARDFETARFKAEAAAKISERESIYLLMADIEDAESGDQGRVRHWLAQALRAPRDPEWVADGQVSPHWLPISPVTGRLDAFEWKQAFGPALGAVEDQSGAHADQAFRTLPAPAREAEPEPATPLDSEPVVEHAVAASEPVDPVQAPAQGKPALVVVDEAAPKEVASTDLPFFGRPPDDPGVKPVRAVVGKQGFKLF